MVPKIQHSVDAFQSAIGLYFSSAVRHNVNNLRGFPRSFLTTKTHTISTGNESVPIQLAPCWFHGLAISNAKT